MDVLVKEMLGRSDRPFSIADVMQRCVEKKLALSETAITQVCFSLRGKYRQDRASMLLLWRHAALCQEGPDAV